jgi:hypothetical protein
MVASDLSVSSNRIKSEEFWATLKAAGIGYEDAVINLIPELKLGGDIGTFLISDGANSLKKKETMNVTVENCGINIMPVPTFPWITSAYFDYGHMGFFDSDVDANSHFNGYIKTQFPSPLNMLINPIFTNHVWHWNSWEDYANTPGTMVLSYYNKTSDTLREKPNAYDLSDTNNLQGIDVYNTIIAQLGLNVSYETGSGLLSPRAYKDSTTGEIKYNFYEYITTMTKIGVTYPGRVGAFSYELNGQFGKGWYLQKSIPNTTTLDVRQTPPYNPLSPTSTWSEQSPSIAGFDIVHQTWDYDLSMTVAYMDKIGSHDPWTLEGASVTGYWKSKKEGRFEPQENYGLKLTLGQYAYLGYEWQMNRGREYAAYSFNEATKKYTNEPSTQLSAGLNIPISGKGSQLIPSSFLDTNFSIDWEHSDGYLLGMNNDGSYKTGSVDTFRAGLKFSFNDISDMKLGNWKVFGVRKPTQETMGAVNGQVPTGKYYAGASYVPQSAARLTAYYDSYEIPNRNNNGEGSGESNFREMTMDEANKKRKQEGVEKKVKEENAANNPTPVATAVPTAVPTQASGQPTLVPTLVPTAVPAQPGAQPTLVPTLVPTAVPAQLGGQPTPTPDY